MTVKYLTQKEKDEYGAKYPFLRPLLEGNIVSVGEKKVDRMPKPISGFEQLTYDCYSYRTHHFEDDRNSYQVHDTNFFLDMDDDKPISVSDHEIEIFIRNKDSKLGRLLILSGPSCVGKGPILEWLRKTHAPGLCQVKVRKTPTIRHKGTEDDIGFGGMSGNRHEFDCRGVGQAIDLDELDKALEENGTVVLETYHVALDFLKKRYAGSFDLASVFVSPLDADELKALLDEGKKLEDFLPDIMLDSLVRRADRDGKAFTRALIRELELRAEDSCNELRAAHNYRFVLANHYSEAHSIWRQSALVGEPRKVVYSVFELYRNGANAYARLGGDYSFL